MFDWIILAMEKKKKSNNFGLSLWNLVLFVVRCWIKLEFEATTCIKEQSLWLLFNFQWNFTFKMQMFLVEMLEGKLML